MKDAATMTVGFAAHRTDKILVVSVDDATIYLSHADADKLCNLMNAAAAMEFSGRRSVPVQDYADFLKEAKAAVEKLQREQAKKAKPKRKARK